MKRKSTSLFQIFAQLATRAAGRRKLPALLALSTPFLLLTYQMQAASAIINGVGGNGYFVQSGSLNLNDVILTNFSTAGGNGSGGGAGLGGAIFINSGASVTLTNVDIVGNTAKGGAGGIGTIGGTLNNYFSGGTTGAAGANGSTPTQSAFTDIGGTTGSKGYNGAFSATGFGGNGGDGGDGGNGGDRSDSLILATTTASIDLVAWGSNWRPTLPIPLRPMWPSAWRLRWRAPPSTLAMRSPPTCISINPYPMARSVWAAAVVPAAMVAKAGLASAAAPAATAATAAPAVKTGTARLIVAERPVVTPTMVAPAAWVVSAPAVAKVAMAA
jgi:hypothetical protein